MTTYKVIKTSFHDGTPILTLDVRGECRDLNSAYQLLALYVNDTDRVRFNNLDCKCEFVIVESEE